MKKEQFLYKQVYLSLKEKICNGEIETGACLPSVEELSKVYDVSVITVTKALTTLKEDGYLNRVKGKGSFARLPDVKASEEKEEREPEALNQEEKPDALRGRRQQKLIGVVLEHISSCFGLDMLYEMDMAAQRSDYSLCVRFSYGDREKETKEIEFLEALGVDGIIVMPCHGTYYNTTILKLVITGFPVVLIDKKMEGIPVSSVRTDNRFAMKQLVDYLVNAGKKQIGFITMAENGTSSIMDRRKGFRDAMKAARLSPGPECHLYGSESINIFSDMVSWEHVEKIEEYLRINPELEAVVCAEYGIARCIGMAARRTGSLSLTVCCVDEDYLSPEGYHFTHVRQDEKKIASEAVRILLLQVEGDSNYRQEDYIIPGIFRRKETL